MRNREGEGGGEEGEGQREREGGMEGVEEKVHKKVWEG
jgi:hypothetical protein